MQLTSNIRDKFSSGSVEKREGKSHGLKLPIRPGDEGFAEQLNDTCSFVTLAREDVGFDDERLVSLLDKYAREKLDYLDAAETFGIESWGSLTGFVKDDECIDLFRTVKKWAEKNFDPREQDGFIDGGGFGYYEDFSGFGKENIEKAFDEKYEHELPRPEEVLEDIFSGLKDFGVYSQPGHPSFPAGHANKFTSVFLWAIANFKLSAKAIRQLFTVCYMAAMGRSGGGVHYPQDNVAGMALLFSDYPVDGVPNFQHMMCIE